ncbi:MAG: EI24 domain-containing protein [Mariprofundaceae bacterium]
MIRGAMALLDGFRLLLGQAELRALLWRMLALQIVLAVLVVAGSLPFLHWLIVAYVPQADAWYWQALAWMAELFAWLLALALAVVAFVTLGSIAAAPWLDMLCLRVEKIHGGEVANMDQPGWKAVLISVGNAGMPLLQFLPWAAMSLLLLLIPVVGVALASVAWGYAGIRLLSFEFMDAPASRRGWKWLQRKGEFAQNKWFHIGFTSAATLLLVVPVVNLLVLPAAVAGLANAWRVQGE